jgi:hypothetical protein
MPVCRAKLGTASAAGAAASEIAVSAATAANLTTSLPIVVPRMPSSLNR